MTLVVIALLMIAAGIVLRKLAGRDENASRSVEVTKMGDHNSNEAQRAQLLALKNDFPGLPAVPMQPLQYDGWFNEVRKRLTMRTLGLTVEQETKLQIQLNALQGARLSGVKTETELQEAISKLAITQRRAMERAQSEDAITKRQSERDLLNMDLEIAKLQRQLDDLKNPPKTDARPTGQTREEKYFAEWRRLQEQRERRIAECKGDPKCEEAVNLFFDHEDERLKEST